ncbi:hypothetical protein GCM10027396_30290 [Insolitispirillum peregrinum]
MRQIPFALLFDLLPQRTAPRVQGTTGLRRMWVRGWRKSGLDLSYYTLTWIISTIAMMGIAIGKDGLGY